MIKPLDKNVLVRLDKKILTDNEGKPHQEGTVVAVGKNVEELKVNDRVIWQYYGESKFERDGLEYSMLVEKNVLATEETSSAA